MKRPLLLLGTVAAVLAVAGSAMAGGPSLSVKPATIHRGDSVTVRGSAGDCGVGSTVFITSRAFERAHEFAGVPALVAKVRKDHTFQARGRVPHSRHAGRYVISARCGGANLGVTATLRVQA